MKSGTKENPYDLFIIGGGVNGCGIAREAAGRGYTVYLAEKGDLASGTSQSSSKLFHGGFRYLQYYDLKLVRESLIERERLLQASPHISWPLRFVVPFEERKGIPLWQRIKQFFADFKLSVPQNGGIYPKWMMRVGLWIYDHLGGRKYLPATSKVNFDDVALESIADKYTSGWEYSDCWVDDARLVVLTAVDAAERGAQIGVGVEVVDAKSNDGLWAVQTSDANQAPIYCRALVNASGAWVEHTITDVAQLKTTEHVRLVRGSHIIVDRLKGAEKAYFLQGADGRVVFILPYMDKYSMIGTTEAIHEGDLNDPECSAEEREYLLDFVNVYLKNPLSDNDIKHDFAGVRPLYDDGAGTFAETTRDYVLSLNDTDAPLLSVFGGKITTYRKLAENSLDKLAHLFPGKGGAWTEGESLPGGDFPVDGFERLVQQISFRYSFLPDELKLRLARCYGTRVFRLLGECTHLDSLGRHFGHGLYEVEAQWLVVQEFARSSKDILWRRTKLGYDFSKEEESSLQNWVLNYCEKLAQFEQSGGENVT